MPPSSSRRCREQVLWKIEDTYLSHYTASISRTLIDKKCFRIIKISRRNRYDEVKKYSLKH